MMVASPGRSWQQTSCLRSTQVKHVHSPIQRLQMIILKDHQSWENMGEPQCAIRGIPIYGHLEVTDLPRTRMHAPCDAPCLGQLHLRWPSGSSPNFVQTLFPGSGCFCPGGKLDPKPLGGYRGHLEGKVGVVRFALDHRQHGLVTICQGHPEDLTFRRSELHVPKMLGP